MSNGLLQHSSGGYRMGGEPGLADQPWLLPISDRPACSEETAEALSRSVRLASRPFRIAANALCAALALFLTVQFAADWRGAARPATGQIADASPPTLPVDRAALIQRH